MSPAQALSSVSEQRRSGSSSGGQSSGDATSPDQRTRRPEAPSPSPHPRAWGSPLHRALPPPPGRPEAAGPQCGAGLGATSLSVWAKWLRLCEWGMRQATGSRAPHSCAGELGPAGGPPVGLCAGLDQPGWLRPARCCLLLGAQAGVAPSQLRVHRLTPPRLLRSPGCPATLVAHAVCLNGEECPLPRPSTYWATFCHLTAWYLTLCQARVEGLSFPLEGPGNQAGRGQSRGPPCSSPHCPAGRRARAPASMCKPGRSGPGGWPRGTLAATCIFREVAEWAVLSGRSAFQSWVLCPF